MRREREILPVVLRTLRVPVQIQLDEVWLTHHLAKPRVEHQGVGRLGEHQGVGRLGGHHRVRRVGGFHGIGSLGGQQVVRRLGVHHGVRRHSGSPHGSSRSDPLGPGSAISSGSILLLLQFTDAGSLQHAAAPVPVGAVTHGMGVVSSGSTLNKTNKSQLGNIFLVKVLASSNL